ncbi:hypothetical protein [Nocardioides pyridinolyticus]
MSGARGQSLRRAALPLVALCAFGCGSSGSSTPDAVGTDASSPPATSDSTPGSTPADRPACETVWQVDETLPRTYRGCVDSTGTLVPRDALGCSSGQRLVRHDDRFWAVLGGTIHEASSTLADDPDFRTDVRSCRA